MALQYFRQTKTAYPGKQMQNEAAVDVALSVDVPAGQAWQLDAPITLE